MAGACCKWPAGGASFGPISHGSQMVKMTQLGSTSLESFSRVLEFKRCFRG